MTISGVEPLEDQRFGYFMLQARAILGGEATPLALVLEDLGTGEKHRFASAEALAAFLDQWKAPISNRRSP